MAVLYGGAKRLKAENGGFRPRLAEPAWELAQQVYDEVDKFKSLLQAPQIQHGLFVGGVDVRANVRTLQAGCQVTQPSPALNMQSSSTHLALVARMLRRPPVAHRDRNAGAGDGRKHNDNYNECIEKTL
jgi:hypothetical protein